MSSMTWGMSYLVVLPRRTWSAAWRHVVGSFGTVAAPCKWSIGLVLYYSYTVATGSHVLHAFNALPAYTSCRPMMALMLGALEACTCALGTCVPSGNGRPTRLFFMFEARCPQGTIGCMTAPEPSQKGGRIQSRRTRDIAEPSPTGR
jgi:hypothetical protein